MSTFGVIESDSQFILGTARYAQGQVIRYSFLSALPTDLVATYGAGNVGYFGPGPNPPNQGPFFAQLKTKGTGVELFSRPLI